MSDSAEVRCSFYIRQAVEGGYRYDLLAIGGPSADGCLVTAHPPAVGDVIGLAGSIDILGSVMDVFRVVSRRWDHPQYGSMDWPRNQRPRRGPILELIIEACPGQFVDEVDDNEDKSAGRES